MAKKIDDIYIKIGGDSSDLRVEIVKTEKQIDGLDNSIDRLQGSATSLKASSDRLRNSTKRLGDSFRRQKASIDRFRSSLQRTGQTMKSVGGSMSARLTAPLALMGFAAAKSAATLEDSFIKMNTLVGISEDTLKDFSQEVERLSDISSKPQEELADALFVVTSAGLRGAEAIEVLEASAKASVIGLGETKDIARAVTAAIQAYGKENLNAARATDILTGIVREGNLEAAELSPVLGRVIGIASQLGVSFEEVGANIATFTRLGVDATEAITGLRGILSVLLKPSAQAAEALQSVGLSSERLRKQVREKGLAKTMNSLIASFRGNEDALAAVIPNVRALAAALGTSGVQAEKYEQILQSIEQSTGLVDDGFDKASKGSLKQFNKAFNDLKNALIEFGNVIIPVLTKVTKKISEIAKAFRDADKNTQLLTAAAVALTAILPPLIGLFGSIVAIIATLGIEMLAAVAVIAALGVAALYVYDNWEVFTNRFAMLWDRIKLLVVKGVRSMLSTLGFFWNKLFEGMKAMGLIDENPFANMLDSLDDTIVEMEKSLTQGEGDFQNFGEFIGGIVDKVKNKIGELASKFSITSNSSSKTKSKEDVQRTVSMKGGVLNDVTSGIVFPEGAMDQDIANLENAAQRFLKATVEFRENSEAELQRLNDGLSSLMNRTVVNVVSGMGQMIGGILSGAASAKDAVNLLLKPMADAMVQAGQMMVAWGLAQEKFFESLFKNPKAAIAVGIGLIAIGSAFSGALQNVSSGNTINQGGFSSGQNINVSGTITMDQNDLRIHLENNNAVNDRG